MFSRLRGVRRGGGLVRVRGEVVEGSSLNFLVEPENNKCGGVWVFGPSRLFDVGF